MLADVNRPIFTNLFQILIKTNYTSRAKAATEFEKKKACITAYKFKYRYMHQKCTEAKTKQ